MARRLTEIEKIIEKYASVLKEYGISVEKIFLFGSFAAGTALEHSDIDLLVISQDFSEMNLRERLEILGEAAVDLMEPIEAKGYTPEEIKPGNIPEAGFLDEIFNHSRYIEYEVNAPS